MAGENGFGEYKKHILETLKRIDSKTNDIDEKVNAIATEIAVLKFKSGLWGATAGMIPVVIMIIIRYSNWK